MGPAKGHFFINGKGCSTNTGPQYNVINAFECISNPTTKNTSNPKLITSTTDRSQCVDRARHERQIGVFSDGRKTRNRKSAYWFVFSSFSMVQNGHFLKRGCSHEGKKGCHTPKIPCRKSNYFCLQSHRKLRRSGKSFSCAQTTLAIQEVPSGTN